MPMKLRIMMVCLFSALVMTACVKEGDFEALKHPMIIEGEFDPVFGFPIAKMSADVGTVINMFDSTKRLTVDVDANGAVTLHITDTMQANLDWRILKKGRNEMSKASSDTIVRHIPIMGAQTTNLFNALQDLNVEGVELDKMLVSVDADVKAHLSNAFNDLMSRGCRVTFDSIVLTAVCSDGYINELPTNVRGRSIDLNDLTAGTNIVLMDCADMKEYTKHKPLYVDYKLRANVAIPLSQWRVSDTNLNLDSIGVDSVAASINTRIDIPLALSSSQFGLNDTMALNLEDLDSTLAEVRKYVSISNHHESYIAFVIDNGLPVAIDFDAMLLDEGKQPVVASLLGGDTQIQGAPIVPFSGNTYMAQGTSSSTIKVMITDQLLNNLAKTRHLVFSVDLHTSNNGAMVQIRPEDRLNVRAYIVASPHAGFRTDTIDLNLPSIIK